MAEMMEMLQKRLEFAFLGSRFWIFAEIGALLVLLTSLKPYFWEYNIPALLVLVAALAWDFWRNAPKAARYGMALLVLVVFMWLTTNSIMAVYFDPIVVPATAHEAETAVISAVGAAMGNDTVGAVTALAGAIQPTAQAVNTLLMGAIGGVLMLVSGLMGLMAAQRA
jgi:hypothetical protein